MARPRTKQRNSLKGFYTALIVLAVAGGMAIAYFSSQSAAPAASPVDLAKVTADSAQGYTLGNADAPVEIREFGDFACIYCANFSVVMEPEVRDKLVKTGQARFTFFDFLVHDNSLPAHLAAACAADQGKFWEMHDRLFHAQADWAAERNPKKLFTSYAQTAGVAVPQWEECYDSRKYESRVLANSKLGQQLGVQSTPTFVIGDGILRGAYGYDSLRAYVAAATPVAGARGGAAAPVSQAAKGP